MYICLALKIRNVVNYIKNTFIENGLCNIMHKYNAVHNVFYTNVILQKINFGGGLFKCQHCENEVGPVSCSLTYFLIQYLFHIFQSPCVSGSKFFGVLVFQGPAYSGSRFLGVHVLQGPIFSGSGYRSGYRFFWAKSRVQV